MSARAYLLGLCCALAACAFDDRVKHCTNDRQCDSDEQCYRGFCVREDGSDAPDAGASPEARGSAGKIGSTSNANTAAGAKAAAAGNGGGSNARAGAAAPPTAAAGNGGPPAATPGEGQVGSGDCKDGEEQPCLIAPLSPDKSEACIRGMRHCAGKSWSACVAEPQPAIEQCNGVDDDCDGELDDNTDIDCFPGAESGCTKQSDGRWTCEGLCTYGKQTCVQGKLGECAGYKAPATEVCTPVGMQAADENCNGMTDESCTCMPGETRSCYSGRAGTVSVGKCVAGTQACNNGALGACMNAVTPAAETCGNQGADDDCDGQADNISNLGGECLIANTSGACRSGKYQCEAGKSELVCVSTATPVKETCNNLDDDCNGRVDDTLDLMTDAKNCGACGMTCKGDEACCSGSCTGTKNDANNCGACGMKCGAGATCNGGKCKAPDPPPPPPMDAGMPMPMGCKPACGANQTCCDGSCVDTATDLKHCGACGNACTGMQPGCCNGKCVDLVSNGNCGQCGRDCSLLTNGGLTCTCTKTADGKVACAGPLLNLCL